MSGIILDVLISVFCLYYGYRLRTNPPEFGSPKGIAAKRVRANPDAWEYGHKFASGYMLLCGGVCAVFTAVQYFVFKSDAPLYYTLTTGIMEFALIVMLIPAINIAVKRKFGDD